MFSVSKKRILSQVQSTDLVPVSLYPHQINDSGNVELQISRFKSEWFGKLVLSKKDRPYFIIELDPLGSRVYTYINGSNSIGDILQLVRSDGKDPIDQLEERGFKFIQQLFNHKYITFKQLLKTN